MSIYDDMNKFDVANRYDSAWDARWPHLDAHLAEARRQRNAVIREGLLSAISFVFAPIVTALTWQPVGYRHRPGCRPLGV